MQREREEQKAVAKALHDVRHYHRIQLNILIIRAISLPENVGLYTCDPYVVVTVVDGDLLSNEAEVGGKEWYNKREQYHGETPQLEGTLEPEWRHSCEAEIRARKDTHIHFRIYDHDAIALEDRGIGQAAIKLADVLHN